MNILNEKAQNNRIFYRIAERRVGKLLILMFSCRRFPGQPVGRTFTANGLRRRVSKAVVSKISKTVYFFKGYGTRQRRGENKQMIWPLLLTQERMLWFRV